MTERDAAAPRLTTSDRVYGGIALAAVLLALWFLVRGGPADGAVADAASRPPRITIEDPRPGAELDQPVTVIVDARTPLRADGADTTSNRHLHVDVGGTMLMPGPGDVRPVGGTRYRWTLPRLPPGTAWLRAYWSDAAHRPVAGASADSVNVRIR
ncbi:MAG TPA: hypothetical protein VM890_07760 [Longimicrobium sp.]|nr:hypothetical protein [Longimicrobium sp.]